MSVEFSLNEDSGEGEISFSCDQPGCRRTRISSVVQVEAANAVSVSSELLRSYQEVLRRPPDIRDTCHGLKDRRRRVVRFHLFPVDGFTEHNCWPNHVRVMCDGCLRASKKAVSVKRGNGRTQRRNGRRDRRHP